MTTRIEWATGKVNALGAWIIEPQGFVGLPVKTGTGVYELTFENEMGVPECCPVVTSWYTPSSTSPSGAWGNSGLKSDGKTLVVNTFTSIGGVTTPTDAAFCVVVDRFAPSSN